MDNFIVKWASQLEATKLLIGRILRYEKVNDYSVDMIDVETEETLLKIDDVLSITTDIHNEVHIHSMENSVFLKRISIGSRFKLLSSSSDRVRVSGNIKNIKEFRFDISDVTAEEFMKYLIHNEHISSNTKYEPKSIMIRRSDEDPHVWIYREDLIK